MDEFTLRRAQQGDAHAFEQLVTPHEPMLWRVCWHYLHHREDAMDCLQEVMLKAWRSIDQYRWDCSFSSWLYRIAASVCIDFLRRQQRSPASTSMEALAESGFEPQDAAPTPEEASLRRENHSALQQAIDALPEDMRTTVILYALEQQRYEDIAQTMNVSVGTVKSRLNRARGKISALLEKKTEQNGFFCVQQDERRTNR